MDGYTDFLARITYIIILYIAVHEKTACYEFTNKIRFIGGRKMKKEKLIKKYDKQVKMYEKNRDQATLSNWRRKLLKNAYGNVLEVGIGVGANFPFYNRENVYITGVDFSQQMINSAKRLAIKANFIQSDIDQLRFEENAFDCIVSTLTLCSYPEPVVTLNKFNEWCKPNGTILLMEHGLSSKRLLSTSQNIINPLFKKISGCHCNRDMIAIIDQSDLQFEHAERYWQDIMCLVWAKPSKQV